jgi:hypothetical protein
MLVLVAAAAFVVGSFQSYLACPISILHDDDAENGDEEGDGGDGDCGDDCLEADLLHYEIDDDDTVSLSTVHDVRSFLVWQGERLAGDYYGRSFQTIGAGDDDDDDDDDANRACQFPVPFARYLHRNPSYAQVGIPLDLLRPSRCGLCWFMVFVGMTLFSYVVVHVDVTNKELEFPYHLTRRPLSSSNDNFVVLRCTGSLYFTMINDVFEVLMTSTQRRPDSISEHLGRHGLTPFAPFFFRIHGHERNSRPCTCLSKLVRGIDAFADGFDAVKK